MPRLENYSIRYIPPCDPYQAPELGRTVLSGNIYEDTRFSDGTQVTTSSVKELSIKNKKATTKNTEYTLGIPDKSFLEWLESRGCVLEDYDKE